jgi:hypothetical protein
MYSDHIIRHIVGIHNPHQLKNLYLYLSSMEFVMVAREISGYLNFCQTLNQKQLGIPPKECSRDKYHYHKN